MRAEVYWIPGPWSGRLGIVPRPRGGDWLEEEVQSWRDAGIDTVVSLLTPDEVDEFRLQDEESRCRQAGLEFHEFPMPDRGVPSSQTEMVGLATALERTLGAGRNVVIHCRQGIGRSSLLAAALLISSGAKPGTAFRAIALARGRPVPDTDAQRDWVLEYASSLYPAGPHQE